MIKYNSRKLSDITNSRDHRVTLAIQETIDKVNEKVLSDKERIRKWTILPKNFSIPGGELSIKNVSIIVIVAA